MMELSEERAEADEMELFFYGFCSTQMFIDYRERIDMKLKFTMVEMAKFYEEELRLDKDYVNEMLFEQYEIFWAKAEPSLQKFYIEIQKILALQPCLVTKGISPNQALYAPGIKKLEAEIEELQEKYMVEKYLLRQLKHRQHIVETTCRPLREKVLELRSKIQKANKKFECLKETDKKRAEKMNKFMENIDKKTRFKLIASDVERNQEKQIMESFINNKALSSSKC